LEERRTGIFAAHPAFEEGSDLVMKVEIVYIDDRQVCQQQISAAIALLKRPGARTGISAPNN
jgi:hypothetical protein